MGNSLSTLMRFIPTSTVLVQKVSAIAATTTIVVAAAGLSLKPDFLVDVIALEGVLIGVAIPLSFQVVMSMVKDYDGEIGKIFIRQWIYRAQYFLFFGNIVIALISRMFGWENNTWLIFMLSWAIVNIGFFWKFMWNVHDYVTEPDKMLIKKISEDVEKIF